MQSNPVSLTKVMLNITAPGSPELFLSQGEVLKGMVQEVRTDGLVTLLLKGRLIEAAAEAKVEPGQQLYLRVDNFNQGKAYLKVLTPEMLSKIEQDNLSAHLRNLGMPVNNHQLQVAEKLIQYGLPVSRDTMAEMARGLQILGGNDARHLELTAWAIKNQIPVRADILDLLNHLTSSPAGIAGLLRDLLTTLEKAGITSRQLAMADKAGMLPRQWAGSEKVLLNQLAVTKPDGGLVIPDKEVLTVREKVEGSAAARLNFPDEIIKQEGALTSSPNTGGMTGELDYVRGSGTEAREMTTLRRVLLLLQPLIQEMSLNLDTNPEQLPAKLANIIKMQPEMAYLLKLVEMLGQEEATRLKNPLINEVLEKLGQLEKELSSQQLMNAASRSGMDSSLPYYYVSLPVKMGKEYVPCELRFQRETNRSMNSQEALKVIVSLQTSRMGRVLFHVDWQRRGVITFQGVVQSEAVGRFMATHIALLEKGLSTLGYQVINKGIKTVSRPEEYCLRPAVEEAHMAGYKPLGVDIVV
ncbi:hypothetical protein ACU70A_10605 [Syntrophomonas erecta subsp. sporosyntropha]